MVQHIHYIWIENSPPLVRKGINLSSKYFINIETHEEDGRMKGKVYIKNNKNFIPGFFGKSNLVDVTGIIGKNGAGKSSILNYIKEHLPQGLQANINHDIIIYSVIDEGNESTYVLYPSEWELEIIGGIGSFELVPYFNFPESTDTYLLTARDFDADYIYYSFYLDYKEQNSDWQGLIDISTAALIEKIRINNADAVLSQEPAKPFFNRASDLSNFIGHEIGLAIQLLISEFSDRIPFSIPEYLILDIDKNDRDFFEISPKNNSDILQLIKDLDKKNEQGLIEERSTNLLLIAILINFLYSERKHHSSVQVSYDFSIKDEESIGDFVIRFFTSLRNIQVEYNGILSTYYKHEELSLAIPDFVAYIFELLERGFLSINTHGDKFNYFIFKLLPESDAAFDKFFGIYLRVKGFTPFLNFRWRGLSTGQQSFLSLMSRFYSVKRHEIGNDEIKKNIVIMIDEGDAGYHPDWQRKFFKNIIDFLCELYSEHYLQLILTANAPFLTSDLPKSNILFLEKLDDDSVIIHKKENNRAETFGSNIHMLFSDSFYMDGAIIGAFAKEKINTIIEYLNTNGNPEPDQNHKKTIEMIGEPLIRRKLQAMWNKKFGLNEELEALQKRIAEIELITRQQ